MTARPPALSTAAAISGELVATTTGPTRGGFGPAQNMGDHRRSGDVGERLAGQPGRRHAGGNEDKYIGHRIRQTPLIRVARRAANRLSLRCPAPAPSAAAEPFGNEFVRNQQDSRRPAGNLPVPACAPYRLRSDFLDRRHRRSPATRSSSRRRSRGRRGGQQPPAEEPIETCWRAPRPNTAKQVAKQCGACHNFQKGGRRSVPISTASSAAGRVCAGFNYSAALKAKGGTGRSMS